MRKSALIVFILFVIVLFGELLSSPRTIVMQDNNTNYWKINHFFNMFHTEYIGPANDTAVVVLTNKTRTKRSAMVNVSDGNTVTLIRSQEVYDNVEIGDTFTLVTTYMPVGRNKYKMKYIVIK